VRRREKQGAVVTSGRGFIKCSEVTKRQVSFENVKKECKKSIKPKNRFDMNDGLA